jgi:hypothetical protein
VSILASFAAIKNLSKRFVIGSGTGEITTIICSIFAATGFGSRYGRGLKSRESLSSNASITPFPSSSIDSCHKTKSPQTIFVIFPRR